MPNPRKVIEDCLLRIGRWHLTIRYIFWQYLVRGPQLLAKLLLVGPAILRTITYLNERNIGSVPNREENRI